VIEARAPQTADYPEALAVQVRTGPRSRIAAEGAVFARDTVRVTKIEGFRRRRCEGYI